MTINAIDTELRRGTKYVTVSQLAPYKRVDLIAQAFRSMPEKELIVIGEGSQRARIEALGVPNVRLLGRLSDATRDRWLSQARAFIFAAEEDFGIAPLEAQAHGAPVIALRRGGVLETIRGLEDETPTGVLFEGQTAEAIARAVREFEMHADRIASSACRQNAARFGAERFRRDIADFVRERWHEFSGRATR